MAAVTDNAKLSLLSYQQPFSSPIPAPVGAEMSQGDKQHLLWQYAGIDWELLVPPPVIPPSAPTVIKVAPPTDPLLFAESIVDQQGRPTRYFLRQWLSQRGVNTSTEITITELNALAIQVAAIRGIDLIAGVGLGGGGDLSGPDRTFDLEDTAVTPGSYTNTNLTVDQQGRLIAVASGIGGGGSVFAWPALMQSSFDTAAAATKGSVLTFFKSVSLTEVFLRIDATSGHTYKAIICSLNGADVIQTIVLSAAVVAGSTGAQVIAFSIASVLILNTRYFIGVSRIDGLDTFSLPIGLTGIGSSTQVAFATFPVIPYAETNASRSGTLAKAAPIVGDTVVTGTGAFTLGLLGSF